MLSVRLPRARRPDETDSAIYWNEARQPLQILAFLLPLVVAYELGLALLLRSDQGVLTNKAHETLLVFFDRLGVPAAGGLYLGGVVIVVVMLVWHLLTRDRWRIEPSTVGLMAIEAVVLTLPLLVLGQVISQTALTTLAQSTGPGALGDQLASLSVPSKMAISVGAGLYEELLFRMVLIAVIHTLLVDAAKLSHAAGATVAVVVSAAAFTVYHPVRDAVGTVSVRKVAFFFLAGLYFAGIFVLRGFGIVVAVHALYDVVTVLLLTDGATGE